MKVSKYNLMHKVPGGGFILFNSLSGAIDFANENVINALKNIEDEKDTDETLLRRLNERGYIFENENAETKELERMWKIYKETIVQRQRYVLIPTYSCNLRCTYCYQGPQLKKDNEVFDLKKLSSAFNTIEQLHKNKNTKPHISLYGGEPLIANKRHREVIEKIVEYCNDNGSILTITTNGVELDKFCDILAGTVNQIQITLDGPEKIHDKRRICANGNGTFNKIVKNIEYAIDANIKIIIRVNVDAKNIDSLPELAKFITQKGWNEKIFCYIAPVKQFFISQTGCTGCLPESELLKKISDMYKKYPEMSVLTLGGWQGIDTIMSLVKTGSIFPPQFSNCEANAGILYVFDPHGNIYTCSAVAGHKDFAVGSFWPEFKIDNDKLKFWHNRSVLNIPKCRKCNVALLCGGGCAVLALSKHNSLSSHYCKPVLEGLKIGLEHYANDLKLIAK